MGSILEIINYNAAYPGILVVIFKQYMFLLIFCQFFLFENLFMVLLANKCGLRKIINVHMYCMTFGNTKKPNKHV